MSERKRYQAVTTVLALVLFLNLAVAVAKLVLGYVTGAVSVISDGLHSLTDSFSNIAGLVGVRVARKPPDADHPYGHRKFETMAAAMIGAFLMVVMIELGRAAWQRLHAHDGGPTVTGASFAVMAHLSGKAGDGINHRFALRRSAGCDIVAVWPRNFLE